MSNPEYMVFSGELKRKSNAEDTALSVIQAAGQYAGYAVMRPINVKTLMFFVTTQITTGLVPCKVAVTSRPTYGSSSGAVTLGSMTIPTASAVGTVVIKEISDAVRVNAGNELSLDVAVQGTDSGTAAGAGFFQILWEPSTEADANQSKIVAGV